MPGRVSHSAVRRVALTERQVAIVAEMANEGYEICFIAERIGRSIACTSRLVSDLRATGRITYLVRAPRKPREK